MTRSTRWVACAAVLLAALAGAGCVQSGGIGMTVPSSGARWSGAGSGPSVFVGGGPVYR